MTVLASPAGRATVDWFSWVRSAPRRVEARSGRATDWAVGEAVGDPVFESMKRQAMLIRDELALHGAFSWLNVRCAFLDRLYFGADTADIPMHLRPLLNRALDLVDRGDVPPEQAEELERLLFEDRLFGLGA